MNMAKMQLTVGARSETGYVRNENQDRMSGDLTPIGNLYIVADGMGGHKGGALAAELTIAHLRQEMGDADSEDPVETLLAAAFQNANRAVYDKSRSDDSTIERMGSTAVLLLLSGQVARVAHVGDSRAYLFRNGQLNRLTTDHTRVQKMVDSGILAAEEAESHPDSHILERAMGIREDVEVDISAGIAIEDGDGFLLCSDGLSGYVSDDEIESVLNSNASVQEIPERLIENALNKGGHDNITIQFIQCGDRRMDTRNSTNHAAGLHGTRKALTLRQIFVIFILFLLALGAYLYLT